MCARSRPARRGAVASAADAHRSTTSVRAARDVGGVGSLVVLEPDGHVAEAVDAELLDLIVSVTFPSPSRMVTSSGKMARISICPPSAAMYLLRVDRKMS